MRQARLVSSDNEDEGKSDPGFVAKKTKPQVPAITYK